MNCRPGLVVDRRTPRGLIIGLLTCCVLGAAPGAWPQAKGDESKAAGAATAPVVIDGETLFALRGVSAFPAERRASEVRSVILEAARDRSVGLDDFRIEEAEEASIFYAGPKPLFRILDVDAEVEDVQRQVLAIVYLRSIKEAVSEYRNARSGTVLLRNALFALGVTGVLLLLLWGARWTFRKLDGWVERHVGKGVRELVSKSHHVIQAGAVWSLIAGFLKLLRVGVYLALAYFYLNTVLGLFPWTRPAARILLEWVLEPLRSIWFGFLGELPDLIFLVVLWFVVRYLLKLIRAFFRGVGAGYIRLENFDAEWAVPTYKIVRILVIALALVLAYPYIPGSDSAAFKGVSVFLGVLLSLGSSSFIANMIAGLTMTYRGAFREGDLIKVGDVVGRVVDVKMMVTKLQTVKNESVILPNSNVLNTDVVNYSQLATTEGLVVHSTVGIGYDTPWRQVEALLIEAATRTKGLKSGPPPFVLQTGLGDFSVEYQINGYWNGESALMKVRSDLHANIQDVFNEHGVQIMSPAYENDPESPKVVPPENWYAAPAHKPES